MTASTPSATMLIGLLMISGPKLPEFRTLIAPLLLVWLWAKGKGPAWRRSRAGAGIGAGCGDPGFSCRLRNTGIDQQAAGGGKDADQWCLMTHHEAPISRGRIESIDPRRTLGAYHGTTMQWWLWKKEGRPVGDACAARCARPRHYEGGWPCRNRHHPAPITKDCSAAFPSKINGSALPSPGIIPRGANASWPRRRYG